MTWFRRALIGVLVLVALLASARVYSQQREARSTPWDFRLLTVGVDEARAVVERFGPWRPEGIKYLGVEGVPYPQGPFQWRHVFADAKGWTFRVNWTTGELQECGNEEKWWHGLDDQPALPWKEGISPQEAGDIALPFVRKLFFGVPPQSWHVDVSLRLGKDGWWQPVSDTPDPEVGVDAFEQRDLGEGVVARSESYIPVVLVRKTGEIIWVPTICSTAPRTTVPDMLTPEAARERLKDIVAQVCSRAFEGTRKATLMGVNSLWLVNLRDDLGLTRLAWRANVTIKSEGDLEVNGADLKEHLWPDNLTIDAIAGAFLCDRRGYTSSQAAHTDRYGNVRCTWPATRSRAGSDSVLDLAYPCKFLPDERHPYMAAQYLSSFGYDMTETTTRLRFIDRFAFRRGGTLELAINKPNGRAEVVDGDLMERPYYQDGVAYLHLRDFHRLTQVCFFTGPDTGVAILWDVAKEPRE